MDVKDIIKLSTRDPTYFVKAYEHTINKAFGNLPDQSQVNPKNEEEKKDSEKAVDADQLDNKSFEEANQ